MTWCLGVIELIMVITLLACLNSLFGGKIIETGCRAIMLQTIIVLVCLTIKYILNPIPTLYLFMEMIILSVYLRIQYKKQWLLILYNILFAMVILDIARLFAVASASIIMIVLGVQLATVSEGIIVLIASCGWCIVTVLFVSKIRTGSWKNLSKGARLGKVLICMTIELIFLYFRHNRYQPENIVIYQILLFAIGFASAILILWILDKKEEEQKMRELISYTHKTREVIPTVGRALNRLDELSDHMDKSSELIEELKSICNQDIKDREKEIAALKTFDTTGSTVLDGQLKRYLEEAQELEFCLDVIVRAPITELLDSGKIERYKLIQLLGDLYRNANKIVTKRDGIGRILICFGYNQNGSYEIAIYDNGEYFPKYILEHLGKRGITTDGTGHGIADILQVLAECRGSFILDQNLEEENLFSKGIRIVFDDKNELEINVR